MNREQFMAALAERNTAREEAGEKIAAVMRALRVQHRRVENLCEIVVPGVAWIGSIVALVWIWHALSAHQLAGIILGHVFFRAFARVYINAILIPRMGRELGRRFPEFRGDIEDVFEKEARGDD
jgi:hypothetical protein